jgi:hypothetical protein
VRAIRNDTNAVIGFAIYVWLIFLPAMHDEVVAPGDGEWWK